MKYSKDGNPQVCLVNPFTGSYLQVQGSSGSYTAWVAPMRGPMVSVQVHNKTKYHI